ncbi:hypothetical protein VNO77_44854 [Canavalia gladiata]|uniref:Uncharacterized protein n=1 Tax=Canavalia gladiata TaxID=3824 RepID=A0AAN9K0E8_CANGL
MPRRHAFSPPPSIISPPTWAKVGADFGFVSMLYEANDKIQDDEFWNMHDDETGAARIAVMGVGCEGNGFANQASLNILQYRHLEFVKVGICNAIEQTKTFGRGLCRSSESLLLARKKLDRIQAWDCDLVTGNTSLICIYLINVLFTREVLRLVEARSHIFYWWFLLDSTWNARSSHITGSTGYSQVLAIRLGKNSSMALETREARGYYRVILNMIAQAAYEYEHTNTLNHGNCFLLLMIEDGGASFEARDAEPCDRRLGYRGLGDGVGAQENS